ncbi:putative transmembrane protein [Paratrimastix pyriformis]|uniref:Transmembrane protein n=1 Tax=Paratrimastix pyriformis TaxID=342808 RepID=A0ABQ8UNV8_9EUKA|nr:putative transmembrane protein [Paratrimastix pyriformis]
MDPALTEALNTHLQRKRELDKHFNEYRKTLKTFHALQQSIQEEVANLERESKTLIRLAGKGAIETEGPTYTQMKSLLPKRGNFFVRLFLGSANIRHLHPNERLALKTEYNSFKTNFSWVLIFLNVLCLASLKATELLRLANFRGAQLVVLWLAAHLPGVEFLFYGCAVYFYFTMLLREHILRSNGSRIKQWWLWHHYLSLLLCVVMMIWPRGPSYNAYVPLMMWGCLYTAFVQLYSSHYQQEKVYKLVSLGGASEMDVYSEHSLHRIWSPTTYLLLGLLMPAHGVLLYNSYFLVRWAMENQTFEWVVFVSAAANFALGLGNTVTTLLTVYQHIRRPRHLGHLVVDAGRGVRPGGHPAHPTPTPMMPSPAGRGSAASRGTSSPAPSPAQDSPAPTPAQDSPAGPTPAPTPASAEGPAPAPAAEDPAWCVPASAGPASPPAAISTSPAPSNHRGGAAKEKPPRNPKRKPAPGPHQE